VLKRTRASCACLVLLSACAAASAAPASSSLARFRSSVGLCYDYDPAFAASMEALLTDLRGRVQMQRRAGKIIGFISTPLSSSGGGYRPLNSTVSEHVREKLLRKHGSRVWILSPGLVQLQPRGGVPPSGSEYMVVWTRLFGGEDGLGRDFDFVYFVGPGDFQEFFGATGDASVGEVDRGLSEYAQNDADFASRIETAEGRREALLFYAFRGSLATSKGSHDEWNTFALINRRRRSSPEFGFARQVAILYDGRSLPPASTETLVDGGYTVPCEE
jgi:hypothetical protein